MITTDPAEQQPENKLLGALSLVLPRSTRPTSTARTSVTDTRTRCVGRCSYYQRVKVLLAWSKPELASSPPLAPKIQSIQCSARLFHSTQFVPSKERPTHVLSRDSDQSEDERAFSELRSW